jgi:hypothetical protein
MRRLFGFFPEFIVATMLTVHSVMGVLSLYIEIPAKIYVQKEKVVTLPEYWLMTMILVFTLFILWKDRQAHK